MSQFIETGKPYVHCDIGISESMAVVVAKRPTVDYLCDIYDGGRSIRLSLLDIKEAGRLPAAVTCPRCEAVARMIHKNGYSLKMARSKIVEAE